MIQGLCEVILYVRDIRAIVAFYRDSLGLAVAYPHDDQAIDHGWVVLETGACKLCLHGGLSDEELTRRREVAGTPKIVFSVEDIKTARDWLVARGVAPGEVRSPAPGVHVVDARDPEGNGFSLESHG